VTDLHDQQSAFVQMCRRLPDDVFHQIKTVAPAG